MIIGLLNIEFHLPGASSLKDKRRVLRSLTVKLKARHNISLAEIAYQDKWQRCQLAVAIVSNVTSLAHAQLERVIKDIERENELIIIDYSVEII